MLYHILTFFKLSRHFLFIRAQLLNDLSFCSIVGKWVTSEFLRLSFVYTECFVTGNINIDKSILPHRNEWSLSQKLSKFVFLSRELLFYVSTKIFSNILKKKTTSSSDFSFFYEILNWFKHKILSCFPLYVKIC